MVKLGLELFSAAQQEAFCVTRSFGKRTALRYYVRTPDSGASAVRQAHRGNSSNGSKLWNPLESKHLKSTHSPGHSIKRTLLVLGSS